VRFLIIAGLIVAGISISSNGALLAQHPESAVQPPVAFTVEQDGSAGHQSSASWPER
jgi:hypothetical protein